MSRTLRFGRGRQRFLTGPEMHAMVVVAVTGFGSVSLTSAALPLWAVSHDIKRTLVGLVATSMFGATILGQVLAPAIGNRLGQSRMLSVGMLAIAAPCPLFLLVPKLLEITVLSAIRGLGFGILTVVSISIVSDLSARRHRGQTLSRYGVVGTIPNLVGAPLGVLLTGVGSFGWVCVCASAPLLAIPFVLRVDEGIRAHASHNVNVRPTTISTPFVLVALPAAGALFVGATANSSLTTFLPIVYPRGLLAASCLFVMSFFITMARWLIGPLSDSQRARSLTAAALGVTSAGMMIVMTALRTHFAWLLLVGTAFAGAGFGIVISMTLVFVLAVRNASTALVASAVWNIAYDFGQALGPPAIGLIGSTRLGLPGAFGLDGCLLLCAVGSSYFMRPFRLPGAQSPNGVGADP